MRVIFCCGMEQRVENEYTALLAYRWFFATYVRVLERKETLRERCIRDDGYTDVFSRHLNNEVRAVFRCTLAYPSEGDLEEPTVDIDYVLELFRNPHVHCSIAIYKKDMEPVKPSVVRGLIDEFCSRTFYVCKCGALAFPRLDLRCIDCYTYWFKRTDNDVCPVCLEDEGRWIQLGCKHVLHLGCWSRTPGVYCPLCRTRNDPEDAIRNYPFHAPF